MSADPGAVEGPAHTPRHADDDDQVWMTMFTDLDDLEIDRLFTGEPTADRELAPIADLAAALRRSVHVEPRPRMSADLRAQLTGPPVVALAARQVGRSALGKAAAAAAAVVALVVGASQNRLPAGIQDVVSSTAHIVGIQVPTAAERGRSETAPNGSSDTAPHGNANGQDGKHGGGATPADPGTPGDHDPATPAVPPDNSNGTPGTSKGSPSETNNAGGTLGTSNGTPPETNNAGGTPDTSDGTPETSNAGGNPGNNGTPPETSNAGGNPDHNGRPPESAKKAD